MAKTDNKMICPLCGVEMNHHSDKLVYTTDPQDARQIDPNICRKAGIIDESATSMGS